MGVKILNLLPVTGDVLTPEMFKYMCKYLEPDTEVQTYQITSGPPSIECEYDEALAAADVLRLAKKGEEDGFQAIFINCFGDPAVKAAREYVNIPVFGGFEPATHFALGLADNISIVTVMPHVVSLMEGNVSKAIEALITADEEIGMLGAFALDCSQLKGHKLINLDSEYEGILMCSCAGGVNVRSTVPVAREAVTGAAVDIVIKGLTSGHSGVEIDKGRANANALMGRMLCELAAKEDFRLAALEGGSRETAIAASSSAQIIVEPGKAAGVCEIVRKLGAQYASEYATAEPNMQVNAVAGKTGTVEVLTQAGTEKVWQVLVSLPDSVQAMCIDMPGLVQTSTNFGTLKLEENALTFSNTVRSSITAQKEWIVEKIAAIVKLAGGTTTTDGNYPGWAYNPHSVVKDTILAAYKKLFNKEATVEAVHAGIECGLFSDSIPNLDCVSIGPDMGDVHTPREHLSIASSQRTYELLKSVLAESK